ncbi:MAG: KilA-N protein [Herbinix sp.]|jgi:hypothetical protein|nr:KilA-N protein [Herbinix sp.]
MENNSIIAKEDFMNELQLQFQPQGGFVDRLADNDVISQRITDGYINATAMCQSSGKLIADYGRLATTNAFLQELSFDMGIPISELVQTVKGGDRRLQGTWVHPQVALHLAQWLSPKFAVLVTKWVFEWMSGNMQQPQLPYHLKRYLVNMPNVPYGYFSMLNEVTLSLIGPLEALGYTVASGLVPDISLGKTFSKHLRDLGYPVDSYPKYPHKYEDGRIVNARAYPNVLIGELRRFFVEEWLRERSHAYFAERDPLALPYLNQFLSLPNYREVMGYVEIRSEANLTLS